MGWGKKNINWYRQVFEQVVSPHLWNTHTPSNLYQQAMFWDSFHSWRCRGIVWGVLQFSTSKTSSAKTGETVQRAFGWLKQPKWIIFYLWAKMQVFHMGIFPPGMHYDSPTLLLVLNRRPLWELLTQAKWMFLESDQCFFGWVLCIALLRQSDQESGKNLTCRHDMLPKTSGYPLPIKAPGGWSRSGTLCQRILALGVAGSNWWLMVNGWWPMVNRVEGSFAAGGNAFIKKMFVPILGTWSNLTIIFF